MRGRRLGWLRRALAAQVAGVERGLDTRERLRDAWILHGPRSH